jgi:hypothetical protein
MADQQDIINQHSVDVVKAIRDMLADHEERILALERRPIMHVVEDTDEN